MTVTPESRARQDDERLVTALYERLIRGWNDRRSGEFAAPFAIDGIVVGYDGSEHTGREEIAAEIQRVFDDHQTASYVAKVRSVEPLAADVALLRAAVGMLPPGSSDLNPDRNAHQTLVARRHDGNWQIVLFQNTPAQFDGRPDLAEAFTAELESARESGEAFG